MTHGEPPRFRRAGDDGLKIGREGLEPIFRFIERAEERPFFLWYAPFMPHRPHTPPREYVERYREEGRSEDLALYYAMCSWFDQTVGELLQYLEQKGLGENTLVVYVADNGWIQRTPRTPVPSGWRRPMVPRSKLSPNEGGIRTPIMLRWPGRIGPGQIDTPVSSVDLAPTILAAAGLSPAPEMRGVDLISAGEVRGRSTVFGADWDHDVADPADPVQSLQHRWCVQGRWKLIVPHAPNISDPRVQLYDVVTDPDETRNLALEQPDRVQELLDEIQQWWPVD